MSHIPAPMERALELAKKAAQIDEVPVGAVITRNDSIIAEAHNQVETQGQALLHAEALVIQEASNNLGSKFLGDCTLWVTLEPCPMCAAAISHARLGKLVFGASDPKSGGVLFGPQVFDQPTCHHRPEIVSGVGTKQAEDLLRAFFAPKR